LHIVTAFSEPSLIQTVFSFLTRGYRHHLSNNPDLSQMKNRMTPPIAPHPKTNANVDIIAPFMFMRHRAAYWRDPLP